MPSGKIKSTRKANKEMESQKITELIYASIDEINETLSDDGVSLDKSESTALFGQDSVLDSIDLVNFISIVEEKLEEEVDEYIPLADERAMSQDSSPFKSVSTLTGYIADLLKEVEDSE